MPNLVDELVADLKLVLGFIYLGDGFGSGDGKEV